MGFTVITFKHLPQRWDEEKLMRTVFYESFSLTFAKGN